jgi:hypothetical protein
MYLLAVLLVLVLGLVLLPFVVVMSTYKHNCAEIQLATE